MPGTLRTPHVRIASVACGLLAAVTASLLATSAVHADTPGLPPDAVAVGPWWFENQAGKLSSLECLDADTSMGGVNGNKVQVWQCNWQSQQHWQLYRATSWGSGWYYIVNERYQKCLDADIGHGLVTNGTKVQLWTCTGGYNQVWYIGSLNIVFLSKVYYNPNNGLCLDADSSQGLPRNGARVQTWHDLGNGQLNQWWDTLSP
jgi:hypothetical protein